MSLGDSINGRAWLVRLGSKIKQAADVFDLEPQVAGVPDEEQPAQQVPP
jgi:hypothetical protein